MKRGYPRPQMHVSKCVTNTTADGRSGVGYGERWDNKNYPVPYTAEEDAISTLHDGRLKECVHFNKCIACGEPVENKTIPILLRNNEVMGESGPFHEKCAKLTERMCPHVAVSTEYGFKHMAWAEVKPKILAILP